VTCYLHSAGLLFSTWWWLFLWKHLLPSSCCRLLKSGSAYIFTLQLKLFATTMMGPKK
jgi:hypothetical protein